MLVTTVAAAALCLGCAADEIGAARTQLLRPEVTISQQLADGCSRFALRVVNGTAQVEALYNTNGCQTDNLRLELDSAAVYDAVTGTLRVPLVIRNLGTVPVVAPARVRFVADSTQFLNGQGQVLPGTPNIVAINYDTVNANGRVGQWRYDAHLAAAGQPQVLPPNGVSGRRWIEFAGSDLTSLVRIKLPTIGTVAPAVPAVAPDSIPAGFYDDSNFVVVPALTPRPILRDMVAAWFKTSTSQAQRASAIASIGGTVVGGARVRGAGDGVYYIRLASDPTNANISTSLATLRANSAVAMAVFVEYLPGPANYRKPIDGLNWAPSDYVMRLDSVFAPLPWRATWALDAIDAPLAWGCSVGSDSLRIGVVDVGLHVSGVTDLIVNLGDTNRVGVLPIGDQHGTHVASVLSARGDNGQGVAGAIWRSRLSLRDVTAFRNGVALRTPTGKPSSTNVDVLNGIIASLIVGDRIINLSVGIDTAVTGVASSALYNSYAQFASAVMSALRSFSTTSDTALLVVSGGNNANADPLYSYFTVLNRPGITGGSTL